MAHGYGIWLATLSNEEDGETEPDSVETQWSERRD